MKRKIFYLSMFIIAIGCAKVNLQTSQPLKVDINMRVDVYQHVVKDVESIQDQIYGSSQKQINAILFLQEAYAQEYSQNVSDAIERRKERRVLVEEYLSKGYIGENKDAYLQMISNNIPTDTQPSLFTVVKDENSDRKLIYKAIADKNGVDISQTAKVFFDDDYKRAPAGYWFEITENGSYRWIKK